MSATPSRVVLETDGVRRDYAVHRRDGWSFVDGPDGSVALAEVPRFADPNAVAHAGSLLAPMPGTVVRVLGEPGQQVEAGQPLVVLEAMKMEHTVAAPGDGILGEVRVAAGDQVDTGQVLAVVDGPGGRDVIPGRGAGRSRGDRSLRNRGSPRRARGQAAAGGGPAGWFRKTVR